MPCIRGTRKKVTTIHKKMRDALTKHKRACHALNKAMNKFNQKLNPLENIKASIKELRDMKMDPSCQSYSDTLDHKFTKLNDTIVEITEEISENAETLLETFS
jgi:uncharacterized protein Yka (UPF0111/DUF47 family)